MPLVASDGDMAELQAMRDAVQTGSSKSEKVWHSVCVPSDVSRCRVILLTPPMFAMLQCVVFVSKMIVAKRSQLPDSDDEDASGSSGAEDDDEDVFLAFARVFSGVLRPDSVRDAVPFCSFPVSAPTSPAHPRPH